jgi:hypothetical protein
MLTFTFAGDEVGDVSFTFTKGATRYFVVALIATSSPDKLRKTLEEVRQQSGLAQTFEFKFRAISSAALRERLFTALGMADFDAWALVVDKTTLPEVYKVISGLDFYLYFVAELIRLVPVESRAQGTLILDVFGSPNKTRRELRRVMKARNIEHGFRRISVRRSQSEPLIQIADLVAGSILRRDSRKDSEAFDLIRSKLRSVTEYP